MKLTTKGRYGTRIMLELALHYNKKCPVLLKQIAQEQEISIKYTHLLISYLRGAGLVRSIRGPKGGYALTKPPSLISLREIVQTLEGSLSPVDCIDDPDFCHRITFCPTYEVWKKMKEAVVKVLDSLTLEDLILIQRKKKNL